jgi:acyl-CoA synthetase (AMP-forming)/AMP-acid ligase II
MELDTPTMSSAQQGSRGMLLKAILHDSDMTAIVRPSKKDSLDRITYRMLKNHVLDFQGQLLAAGFRKGDVVALLIPNSFAFVVSS